jgi:hypothetical protein
MKFNDLQRMASAPVFRVKDKLDEWIYFLTHGCIEKDFAAHTHLSLEEIKWQS